MTAVLIALPVVVGVAWLTLAPTRVEQRMPGLVDSVLEWARPAFGDRWGRLGPADAVANVAVFFVVGVLAFLIIPRRAWIVALLVGPVVSAAIELFQRAYLPERVPSALDVVWATIGSTLGVAVAALCTYVTARRRRPVPQSAA